jgi:hypothetical protein
MKLWLTHLLNAAINGAASGVLAAGGATALGVPMGGKQLGAAALSGLIVGTVRHIQQSPLIPTDTTTQQ